MARGDHIYVFRTGFSHHGIDIGDGTVIHWSGEPGQKANAVVRRTTFADFARGSVIRVQRYGARSDADVIIARAESRLGSNGYDLVANNCEHFARWCVTGTAGSSQVVRVATAGGVAIASAGGAAATVNVISRAGTVAGLSGPGIMSGLSAAGSVVGGGVTAGLVVLAAAPAALSALLMNNALGDSDIHSDDERFARTVGRSTADVSAVVGLGIVVGTVSVAGTVAGLSGPGIASGLAAIGHMVGGGMAAGVTVAAIFPALLAALVGYAGYRLVRLLGEPGPSGRLGLAT